MAPKRRAGRRVGYAGRFLRRRRVPVALVVLVVMVAAQLCCRKPTGQQTLLRLDYLDAKVERTAASLVPSYRFVVGQRLSYSTECRFPWTYGTEVQTRYRTAWVTDRNADGSWRVVLCVHTVKHVVDSLGMTSLQDTSIRVVYADMFPDGRHSANPTLDGEDPFMFFPRMPADPSEAKAGWTYPTAPGLPPTRCVMLGMTATEPKLAAVRVEVGTAGNAAWSREVALFDTALGLMRHREGKFHVTRGWKSAGVAVGKLDYVVVLSQTQLESIKRDADAYFEYWYRDRELMELMHRFPAQADSLGVEEESVLVRTKRLVRDSLFLKALDYDMVGQREHTEHVRMRK
jgi:hypothetical protein